MMLDALFTALDLPGFIIGTVAAAMLFWWLGLREPFLLTLASLVVGGGCGAAVEWRLNRANSRRSR